MPGELKNVGVDLSYNVMCGGYHTMLDAPVIKLLICHQMVEEK